MALNVVIMGGGFAGLAAAGPLNTLARERRDVRITLLDSHPYTTMIPCLPDLAGGRCAEKRATGRVVGRIGPCVAFQQEEVISADFDRREVTTRRRMYRYDYLLVATGSVTNLFGFDQHVDAIHTLDSLDDASRIRLAFAEYAGRSRRPTALVVGGGYTGLELACNLRFLGRRFQSQSHVCVVELAPDILPSAPEWVRRYMHGEAARHGIELVTGASIESFDGRNATLSNGRRVEDVFLCWTAGSKFALGDIRGRQRQMKDGRLVVDTCLRVTPHPEVFAAGDSAAMKHGETLLRKAVNFSIGSGIQAGRNIAAAIRGQPLHPFRPVDPGWVIPFCDVGVGQIFPGLRVRGRLPLALHYAMCGVKNYSLGNRLFFWGLAIKALCSRVTRPRPRHGAAGSTATRNGHVPGETGSRPSSGCRA